MVTFTNKASIASLKVSCDDEIIIKLKAAGLLYCQDGTKMSSGRELSCAIMFFFSTNGTKFAAEQDHTTMSQNHLRLALQSPGAWNEPA